MYHGSKISCVPSRHALSKQRGVILFNVLIGSFIGLLVLSAAIKVYIDNIKASGESLKSSKLNQEVNAILHLITRDVRRAGYWGANPSVDNLAQNPFFSGFNDLTVSFKSGQAADSCVTYSYDLNKDMAIGVTSSAAVVGAPFDATPYNSANLEQFGFRLNGTSLEMRQGLSPGDIDVSCNSGTWLKVNSNIVDITNFNLLLQAPCYSTNNLGAACVSGDSGQYVRSLRISITAALRNDSTTSKSASAFVKIRNDKYVALVP